MSDTFPLFPHFPPELRLLIWDLCLPPTRLIPMSLLTAAYQQRQPGEHPAPASVLTRILTVLTQPVPIAAVCREARRAAHTQRRVLGELGVAWLKGIADHGYFDPRFDTILVDCDVFGHYAEAWGDLCAALKCGQKGGVGVAVRHQVLDFPKPAKKKRMETEEEGPGLGPVMVGDAVLLVTDKEAMEGGCFGLFGEGRSAIFDIRSVAERARLDGLMEFHNKKLRVGYDPESIEKELASFKDLQGEYRSFGKKLGLGTGQEEEKEGALASRPYPVFVVRRDF